MLDILVGGLVNNAPAKPGRIRDHKIAPTERQKGSGRTGAERTKSYERRFVKMYGRELWKRARRYGIDAVKEEMREIRRQRDARYKEKFIAEHGEEAWKARRCAAQARHKQKRKGN